MAIGGSSAATILIRLQGAAEFVAQAREEAAALKQVGTAAQFVGREVDTSRKRSWLFNQALFTARRYLYGFTLAASAAITTLAAWGWQFDSFKQQSTLAFTSLLGNAELAKNEISYLFQVAAKTPFTFQNVTATARQFLAFGFSLKQTNQYLGVLGDTISAFGLSGDQISHLAVVFGQIHQSGRLLGQDMRQLEQAGIPVFPALRKELGLTQAQVTQFMKGQLVIPSQYGIPAIMKYLQARFGGMAAIQAKTFQGEASTFKDYISQLMGTLEEHLFNRSSKALGRVNDALTTLQNTLSKRGFTAFLKQLDDMLGQSGKLVLMVGFLKNVFGGLVDILIAVWGAMKIVGKIVIPLFYGLYFLGIGFKWVMDHAYGLQYVLVPLIILLGLYSFGMMVARIATYLVAAAAYFLEAALATLEFIMGAATFMTELLTIALTEGAGAAWASFAATLGLSGAFETLALTAMYAFDAVAALWAIVWPVALVVFIIALIAVFVILMIKVKAFREFMFNYGWAIFTVIPGLQWVAVLLLIIGHWKKLKEVFWDVVNFIKSHWLDLVLFITTGGLGNILYHFWDPMVQGFAAGWNWIQQQFWSAVNWIEGLFKKLWDHVKQMARDAMDPRNWIPFGLGSLIGGKGSVHFGWKDALKIGLLGPFAGLWAEGGVTPRTGLSIVGEKGPEIVWLPKGTNITPMSQVGDVKYQPLQQYGGNGSLHLHIPVNINGTSIAEANAAVLLDQLARQ